MRNLMILCHFTLTASLFVSALMLPFQTFADSSVKYLDYSVVRPLEITTKISNGLRFDLITSQTTPFKDLPQNRYYQAGWYGDELLVVRMVKTGELLHAQPLKSSSIMFMEGSNSKKLSDDYVVLREHSGGASCCLIIHAFQTAPNFKKVLEHNNKYFDMTEVIHGGHMLELHKEPFFSGGSSAPPEYNAAIFNLKENGWE